VAWERNAPPVRQGAPLGNEWGTQPPSCPRRRLKRAWAEASVRVQELAIWPSAAGTFLPTMIWHFERA